MTKAISCQQQHHLRIVAMMLSLCLLLLVTFSQANAAIYKCTSIDPTTKVSQVVYADEPCDALANQKIIVVEPAPVPTASPNDNARDLDYLVTQAVLRQDFRTAKALATTKEHWRLIAMAEYNASAAPQQPTQNVEPQIIVNNVPDVNYYEPAPVNNGVVTNSRAFFLPYGYQLNRRPYRYRHGYNDFNRRQGFGRQQQGQIYKGNRDGRRAGNLQSNNRPNRGLKQSRGISNGSVSAKTFGVEAHTLGGRKNK